MKFRHYLPLFSILLLARCANEAAPTGGTKDATPPKLLRATPLNESRNFKGKNIKLQFDEYLNYSLNVAEIQVTPELLPAPKYYVSGKTLNIKLPKTVDSNTTYNIQFGDAIKDINEGNILPDATFCFATGDSLDVCLINGNVIALKDMKPVESVLIGLYRDTGNFAKPIYYTKTDKNGSFSFRNIKRGNYRLAGFEDRNMNKEYNAGDGQSGFLDTMLHIVDTIQNIRLNLFPQNQGNLISEKTLEPNKLTLAFNHAAGNVKLLASPKNDIEFFLLNDSRDTLRYWYKNTSTDSIYFSLINEDSLTTFAVKTIDSTDTLRIIGNGIPTISPLAELEVEFNNPLQKTSTNRLAIFEDSLTQISTDKISVKEENTKLKIAFPKKGNKTYTIEWRDSCVTDIFGTFNKAQKTKVNVGREVDFANLILKKAETDERTLLIEIRNSAGITVARKTLSPQAQTVTIFQLPKGTYSAIGTIDANQNGWWDSGDFDKQIQPEKRSILKSNIELKGGWEVEAEIKFTEGTAATDNPSKETGNNKMKF